MLIAGKERVAAFLNQAVTDGKLIGPEKPIPCLRGDYAFWQTEISPQGFATGLTRQPGGSILATVANREIKDLAIFALGVTLPDDKWEKSRIHFGVIPFGNGARREVLLDLSPLPGHTEVYLPHGQWELNQGCLFTRRQIETSLKEIRDPNLRRGWRSFLRDDGRRNPYSPFFTSQLAELLDKTRK